MLTTFLLIIIFTGVALSAWRFLDHLTDRAVMHRLMYMQPVKPAHFDPGMTSDLPEPARRYFLYTIKPGTPLYRVAKISMSGRFGMGTRTKPGYLHMTAKQILAMPAGFIWKMRARSGLMTLSGSDSERWTRFWLMGLLPVARMARIRIIRGRLLDVMWLKQYSGHLLRCCPAPMLHGSRWIRTVPDSL